uniref:Protein brambleberry n=1 Tax=Gadus morhua TaxID=8049 RepID=A0A8C5FBP8_GADMO
MAPFVFRRLCSLLFCMLALRCHVSNGLFEWLKPAQAPPAATLPAIGPTAKDSIPFEMTIADEKFLAEARQMELSPLGSCHYKVVAQLKSTCESLSEEQLAKLGVMLFNCQAQVEGRPTYPCSEEMSIKECTAEMDSDTWNAYHIVSNRVRSVCYGTRQLHFRRKAEMTVNALISTASSQLDAMNELKDGQVELKELTVASLDKLMQGHKALQAQQGVLWEGQGQLERSLDVNLEHLGKEKALIASGQQLVAQLIQGITHRMENVSEQLKGQGSEVQENHKAIIEDLAHVRDKAQDIYHKIDSSMVEFVQYQDTTAQYYTDLMRKLERMNGTLGFMLHYLDGMQNRIEGRLHMIQGYLGWAGLSLAAMCTCVLHGGYVVMGAILLTFLRSPFFSRVTLLFTVSLNAVAEVNQQPALDFTGLSLLILVLTLGRAGRELTWRWSSIRGGGGNNCIDCKSAFTGDPCPSVDGSPNQEPLYLEERVVSVKGTPTQSTPKVMRVSRLSMDVNKVVPLRNLGHVFDSVSDTRNSSSNTSLAGNSTLSRRQLCNGITKTGKACKRSATRGHEYCNVHEGGYTYVNP